VPRAGRPRTALVPDHTRIEALGRDHAISRATACRYVFEAVDVLSEQAPGLEEALERALTEGIPYVILDGKVFASDRCAEKIFTVDEMGLAGRAKCAETVVRWLPVPAELGRSSGSRPLVIVPIVSRETRAP
jgi:hypothetical protein